MQAADGRMIPVVDGACQLDAPGLYRAGERLIAAAIPGVESDLRRVPVPSVGERTRSGDGDTIIASAAPQPLWHWLLVGALVLLALESALTLTRRRDA